MRYKPPSLIQHDPDECIACGSSLSEFGAESFEYTMGRRVGFVCRDCRDKMRGAELAQKQNTFIHRKAGY